MAGLSKHSPTPQDLTVHSQSRVLQISFSDGADFRIPFELMRIYSPSAEVQGHGPGQEVLQTGKRLVDLEALQFEGEAEHAGADTRLRRRSGRTHAGQNDPPAPAPPERPPPPIPGSAAGVDCATGASTCAADTRANAPILALSEAARRDAV